MQKLITIDLTSAVIDLFESYERKVMPLLEKYGGRLELSVRSTDEAAETHVLYFPDVASFEGFLADPDRAALQDEWIRTGATSSITEVEGVSYF